LCNELFTLFALGQGHDVNSRDTAGWTPLHEAANFGQIDCIEALLKAGALINDQGGKFSEGITPLHDALGNGHLAVAQVLLDSGANVLIQDDHVL
jgi:NF-kappa-B inhibitor-like protein 2